MEENLPGDAEAAEYNWQALAAWFNARYNASLKDKDLRKAAGFEGDRVRPPRPRGRPVREGPRRHRSGVEIEPAREFLLEDWGRRTLAGWAYHKFGVALDPAGWTGLGRPEIVRRLQEQARQLYDRKEAEFPVRVGLTKFLAERSQGQQSPRYDRDGLAAWATDRFGVYIDPEEIRSKLRPEIEALLLDVAHREYDGGKLAKELEAKILDAYGAEGAGHPADARAAADLAAWAIEPSSTPGRPPTNSAIR